MLAGGGGVHWGMILSEVFYPCVISRFFFGEILVLTLFFFSKKSWNHMMGINNWMWLQKIFCPNVWWLAALIILSAVCFYLGFNHFVGMRTADWGKLSILIFRRKEKGGAVYVIVLPNKILLNIHHNVQEAPLV